MFELILILDLNYTFQFIPISVRLTLLSLLYLKIHVLVSILKNFAK